jgi:DNA repair exonuclease SbcCD nuclease subunit
MMGEFNEQTITIDDLTDFDYVALGHYHKCTRVRADAYYAGSTERFSFSEVNSAKSFLEVRLGKDGGNKVIVHALRTRAMLDLEPIRCSSLDEHEIKNAIRHRIRECNPQDKVVRLKVQDMPLHVYHSLDFDELKRLTRSAVHFELKYEFQTETELLSVERPAFQSLHAVFDHFVGKYTIGADINKEKLRAMGSKYMQEWAGDED